MADAVETDDWLVSDPALLHKPIAIWIVSARGTYATASLVEILRTMSTRIVDEAAVTLPYWTRPSSCGRWSKRPPCGRCCAPRSPPSCAQSGSTRRTSLERRTQLTDCPRVPAGASSRAAISTLGGTSTCSGRRDFNSTTGPLYHDSLPGARPLRFPRRAAVGAGGAERGVVRLG